MILDHIKHGAANRLDRKRRWAWAEAPMDFRSTRIKAALSVALALAYVVAYAPLQPVLDDSAGILVTVPVVVSGWLFGLRVGFVAGVTALVGNGVLAVLVTDTAW